MHKDVRTRFPQSLRELSSEEVTLLTALALIGAANISTIADLARAVGLRETSTRQHSTATLRPVVSSSMARGLVYEDGGRFACRPALRAGILRHSAAQQRLRPLASAALQLDAAWFDRLPEDFVERWLDAALGQCEALGDDISELIALLVARWDRLAGVPARAVCPCADDGETVQRRRQSDLRATASKSLPQDRGPALLSFRLSAKLDLGRSTRAPTSAPSREAHGNFRSTAAPSARRSRS